ncbi:hypothetical protein ACF1BP_35545 [Streptomyces sp. NPDC014735]|uniref:hypothetical protein n=1 Tax=unclassified Streptomyces TaxID=2593676 RepID=UPI0036FD9976
MREVEYRSHGVPLEDYELTRRDYRRQKESEEICQAAQRMADEDLAKCRADPARAERRRQAFEEVAKLILTFEKHDHEIMRWRARLYCGHIVETRAHYSYTDPISAGAHTKPCPECGAEDLTIVAYEPIGLLGERPEPQQPPPPQPPKRPTRAELERRVAALEEENKRLRAKRSPEGHRLPDGSAGH